MTIFADQVEHVTLHSIGIERPGSSQKVLGIHFVEPQSNPRREFVIIHLTNILFCVDIILGIFKNHFHEYRPK